MLSDIVVMSSDARIGDPHVRAGLVAAAASSPGPFLLPLNVVKELLFTGRLLSAIEAQQLGLVNRVVDSADLNDGDNLAEDLASVPQPALRFTERVLNKILIDRATYTLDLGLALEAVTLGTTEHKDAVNAFITRSQRAQTELTAIGPQHTEPGEHGHV